MIGQLDNSLHNPFQCTLMLISVLSQKTLGHTLITAVYRGEHCSHWCTLGISSLIYGAVTELVWTQF